MFTGLIEEVGVVRSVRRTDTGAEIAIQAAIVLDGTRIGDSIACNGCCLTATSLGSGFFTAHAGTETLARTTVGAWKPGDRVNLERALSVGGRLGGHFLQGHVDGVGAVLSVTPEGETTRWRFSIPSELAAFIVEKGSIAIDGISLTVTAITSGACEVAIIPHTLAHTTLGTARPGDRVNLEVDILAKYVRRILLAMGRDSGGITEEFLREQGFC
ncbi:MAG: riboflavin synthase [Armatimonadetes bacterium]|nr:riboflavin synthase [Armatimonadota bacterium]